MGTIAIIVVFFALGMLARSRVTEVTTIVKGVNRFIIYLSLPALILLNVPQLALTARILLPAGFAWLWLLIGGLTAVAVARWKNWPREIEGALLLLVVMGNTSFVGLPLIQAFFDKGVLGYAIFYDQLGSFLILSTAGLLLVLAYSPHQAAAQKPGALRIFVSVLKFPPMISLLAALCLPIDGLVAQLEPGLALLGMLLMPCALFVVGIQFRPRLLPEHRQPVVAGVLIKMCMAPVFAALFVTGMGSDYEVRAATVFQAAMPCMITPGLLAINAGIAPRLVAALLGYGSLFAFISLPLIYLLLA
jgi:predicted permease